MLTCLQSAARGFALTIILTASFAAVAVAQEPTPTPPASSNASQLPPVSRVIPQRSVGLEAGKTVRWSLRDAILAALENNPDIEIDRSSVRQSQWDVVAAEGAYDPISTHGLNYNSNSNPNTRPFSGAGNAAALTSKNLNFNFGHQGLIYRTGGSYQVNFNNRRQTTNFTLFKSQYDPQLSFALTQPLWRNYKVDRNRYQIQIAKKRLDLSDAQFRQRAIEIISRVQTAYWNLALALKDEEIQRDSVKLAETQLSQNQRQVEVGTLAPIDVVSAATVLETRRQQVFQAMESIAQAENNLKNLTVNGASDPLWKAQIQPVESFEASPLNLPVDDAIKLAMDNRPELKQFALQKSIKDTDIGFLRNQTKPQVDFTFNYGTFGVGGNPITSGNCSPLSGSNPPLCANVIAVNENGTLVPRVITTPFVLSPAVGKNFIGGYGTGLARLFSNEFRTWTVGVNIQVPWRNRTAKANLGRAIEENRQIDLQVRRQSQNIAAEVRNAVQSVETAKMRIEASRAARIYAEQQLEGEQKKFAAGLSTTFFVLQRQTELSQSRGSELRALTDYNIAVASLQRVISTTLSSNSIEVKSEANALPGDKPWADIK